MKHSIYIDAQVSTEIRVAVCSNNKKNLLFYDSESSGNESDLYSIYVGTITKVDTTLQCAFVDYGDVKNGLLPLHKIYYEYFSINLEKYKNNIRPLKDGKLLVESSIRKVYSVDDLIKPGMYIVVQIIKDKRQNKGALLTTYIELHGAYLTLQANPLVMQDSVNEVLQDIIRKNIPKKYHEFLFASQLIDNNKITEGNASKIVKDANNLITIWSSIRESILSATGIMQVYSDNRMVKYVLYEYLNSNCHKVYVEGERVLSHVKEIISYISPVSSNKLVQHIDNEPIFTKHNIENLISSLSSNKVHLPSGGYIVISHTEALTTIDVNSGKFNNQNKRSSISETAYKVNLEATQEICKHIVYRNISGIIVIDFIDFDNNDHKQAIEKLLRSTLLKDDIKQVVIGKMTLRGIMVIMRQRVGLSMYEKSHEYCPECDGSGYRKNIQTRSSCLIREIRSFINKHLCSVIVYLHGSLYEDIFNNHYADIIQIRNLYKKYNIIFKISEDLKNNDNWHITKDNEALLS